MRLFPDTLTFLKAFCFSRHFPDFPTYHKIPDFFPISRPGGDPVHSERAVTSMAKRLVFLIQQVTVRYPCVTDSESGHDRLLIRVECVGSVAQTFFQVWKCFKHFISGFIIP